MRAPTLAALLFLASGQGCQGCRERAPVTSEGVARSEREAPPTPSAREAESLYGDDGVLLESDRVIAGLPMPRGLELRHEGDRLHLFSARLPPADLLRYFGPRLLTGEVTQLGEGAVYRNGVPRGVRGGAVRLDVAIRPTPKGAQVEIVELPPPPDDPPSPRALGRALEQQPLQ